MWDLPRSRHALASGVAAVLAVIIAVVFWTSPHLRSIVGGPFGTSSAPSGTAGDGASLSASQTSAPSEGQNAASSQKPASSDQASLSSGSGSSSPPAAPGSTPSEKPAVSASQPVPSPVAAGADATDTGKPVPSFDIVRVSPSGDSVVAARATPNTDIALMDGDQVIARGKTDASGQIAFLPPPLSAGEHTLALATGERSGSVSSQSVAVSVPEKGDKTAPMVAVLAPNQGTKILSGPVAGAADLGSASRPLPTEAAGSSEPTTAIQSVEVEDHGSFYATGKAAPGNQCHVYLNGSFVATVTADGNGLWSLQIKRGMKAGHYAVRVDQVERKTGKVISRAEVPFDYPDAPAIASQVPEPSRKLASAAGIESSRKLASTAGSKTASVDGTPLKGSSAPASTKPGANRAPTAASATRDDTRGSAQATARSTQVASTAKSSPVASSDSEALTPTVIDELLTAKVIRGDTLWRISRKMLGHGVRYTQIYAANTQQIRNPRLIFPGQVFVLPHTETR